MLELHARRATDFSGECDLDLAGLGDVRFVLPLRSDLPGDDDTGRRLPDQDAAPRAVGPVDLLAVTPAPGLAFDNRSLHRGRADVMSAGPPGVEAPCEHVERPIHGRIHADRFQYGRHSALVYCRHRSSSWSAAVLNAASASVQNRSKYCRSASMPSGLT